MTSSGDVMEASFDDAISLRRLGNGRFAASTPPNGQAELAPIDVN